ncbi:MAG: bifunctional hydroxymethylpyrimidine kinase/phosphomethylpyrimidine kinase [Acidobacteriaceae bacterium]
MTRVPVVLTIAGFDPSSGAGITADLKTIAAHGMYGVACATALTVQSTQGVRSVSPVSAAVVRDSLACLADDVSFSAIKIGMLATAENVSVVADFLAAMGPARPPTVLDPVLRSSSGRELLVPEGLRLMRERLLPLVDWITPNLNELEWLLREGLLREGQQDAPKSSSRQQIPSAAARLRAAAGGRLSVVVTGGDLEPPDDYVLAADGLGEWLAGERVQTISTHGTGCAFSTALACCLAANLASASGNAPVAAVASAKLYVAGALRHAYPVGRGAGPMNHLWREVR